MGRHDLAATAFGGETGGEDDFVAGFVRIVHRIGDGAFAHQPFPGNVLQRRHHLRHLGEHVGGAIVAPVEPHALADLLDDPEILPRIARRLDHLARELHPAIGVGEGAILLGKRRSRQDDVGVERGFGDEQVLNDQMIEHGQRLARMLQIGIRHRGIFALDVHAVDLARMDRIHDLDHGQAAHRIDLLLPQMLERLAQIGAADRLVIRQEHRNQAGVGGALHIVLAAQRMQPGAGPSHLAGGQRQRNQAARVVSAVHMLADAHAPEDDRGPRRGVLPRHLFQRLGGNAADRLHLLRREILDALLQVVEAFGVAGDVLVVGETLGDDGVQHGVEHRHVGAGLELQVLGGMARQRLPARIGDHQLGAALRRVLDVGCRHRMVHGRIGADHQDEFGIHGGGERRRYRTGIQALHQRRHRRGMAQTRAVIDIVGAEAGAHQLLEQIGLFVRALGRTEAGQRLDAPLVADFHQPPGGDIQRLVPRCFAEVSEGIGRIDLIGGALRRVRQPHQRLGQPVRMVDIVEAESALDAEPVVIGRAVAPLGIDYLLVLDLIGYLATDAAERAQRVHLPVGIDRAGLAGVEHRRGHQRARRAGLHALAAGDAGGFSHRIVEVEHDLGVMVAIGHADDVVDLHLAAGPHAQAALDAGVEIDAHGRMAGVA